MCPNQTGMVRTEAAVLQAQPLGIHLVAATTCNMSLNVKKISAITRQLQIVPSRNEHAVLFLL